jgi:hypothetical protein
VSDDEPEAAPIAEESPRPRRKKKRKRAAREDDRPAAPPVEAPLGSRTTALIGAAVATVAAYLVGSSETAPSGYTLLALGVGAFLTGASYEHPRRTVLGSVCVVAIGLAALALSKSPWAVSIAVGGGMTLAGGIHLLGRMGPPTSG